MNDALKSGDRSAWERFVRGYTPRLHRFIGRMAGRRDAEDILQEVFLRIFQSLSRYRDDDRMDAWIFRIARNVCIDHLRMKRPGARPLDEEASASVGGQEVDERLRRAIMDLPGEQRIVFLLREEAGISFKEIAEMCGIPLNTALGRMHYAIVNLRKSLSGYLS